MRILHLGGIDCWVVIENHRVKVVLRLGGQRPNAGTERIPHLGRFVLLWLAFLVFSPELGVGFRVDRDDGQAGLAECLHDLELDALGIVRPVKELAVNLGRVRGFKVFRILRIGPEVDSWRVLRQHRFDHKLCRPDDVVIADILRAFDNTGPDSHSLAGHTDRIHSILLVLVDVLEAVPVILVAAHPHDVTAAVVKLLCRQSLKRHFQGSL